MTTITGVVIRRWPSIAVGISIRLHTGYSKAGAMPLQSKTKKRLANTKARVKKPKYRIDVRELREWSPECHHVKFTA